MHNASIAIARHCGWFLVVAANAIAWRFSAIVDEGAQLLAIALLSCIGAAISGRPRWSILCALLVGVAAHYTGNGPLTAALALAYCTFTARAAAVASHLVVILSLALVSSVKQVIPPGTIDRHLALAPFLQPEGCPVYAGVYGGCVLLVFLLGWAALRPSVWRCVGCGAVAILSIAVGVRYESVTPASILIVLLATLLGPANSRKPTFGLGSYALFSIGPRLITIAITMSGDVKPDRSAAHATRVAFVQEGHFSLEAAELRQDNPNARPNFAAWALILSELGVVVDVVSSSDPKLLTYDALVTVNLSPTANVQALKEATSKGASLLVLADHTWMFDQGVPTNTLLQGTGILVSFDSAVPIAADNYWLGAMEVGGDRLFGPHLAGREIPWSVGCSLSVEKPAVVLALAGRGYRDLGNSMRPGGLGNLRRDHQEQLGGFPVAAASQLGEGAVLVLGDTSALQSAVVAAGMPFATRLGDWLRRPESGGPGSSGTSSALLGLLGIFMCMYRGTPSRLAVASLVVLAIGMRAPSDTRVLTAGKAPAVVIDRALAPRLGVWRGQGESCTGLVEEASSLGYFVRYDAWTSARPQDVVVFIEPQVPMSDSEVASLLAFVEAGGRVVVFCGPSGNAMMAAFLNALELRIGVLVGPAPISAWENAPTEVPLVPRFHAAYEIRGSLQHCDIVATGFGLPTAVTKRHEAGRVLLIGDPGLALTKHTAPSAGGSVTGRRTLRRMLATIL